MCSNSSIVQCIMLSTRQPPELPNGSEGDEGSLLVLLGLLASDAHSSVVSIPQHGIRYRSVEQNAMMF